MEATPTEPRRPSLRRRLLLALAAALLCLTLVASILSISVVSTGQTTFVSFGPLAFRSFERIPQSQLPSTVHFGVGTLTVVNGKSYSCSSFLTGSLGNGDFALMTCK